MEKKIGGKKKLRKKKNYIPRVPRGVVVGEGSRPDGQLEPNRARVAGCRDCDCPYLFSRGLTVCVVQVGCVCPGLTKGAENAEVSSSPEENISRDTGKDVEHPLGGKFDSRVEELRGVGGGGQIKLEDVL